MLLYHASIDRTSSDLESAGHGPVVQAWVGRYDSRVGPRPGGGEIVTDKTLHSKRRAGARCGPSRAAMASEGSARPGIADNIRTDAFKHRFEAGHARTPRRVRARPECGGTGGAGAGAGEKLGRA